MLLKRIFRPWIIVTFICLIYALAVVFTEGNALSLVTIGSDYIPDLDYAFSNEGYDGQFVYIIARDGISNSPYIDVPAYRAQRILLPFLGGILAFGQVSLIPWTLLLVNLIATAAGVYLLESMLRKHNLSHWYSLGYGLSLGILGAVRLSTTEPLAYALVIGGIFVAQREKWWWTALLFAFAALAKETTLVFPAMYSLYMILTHRWKSGIRFGMLSIAPFIGLQIILYSQLGQFGIGSGGNLATNFEIIPFMGIIRILTEGSAQIFLIYLLILAPVVVVPVLWGLRQCWHDIKAGKWSIYTLLLLGNTAIMLFIPFSTYREFLGILRFIVGLQIAVIVYAAQTRNHRVLRNSTLWAVTSLFVIASDFG